MLFPICIKDTTDDFTVVAADAPRSAAGVFTRSSFAGPSVLLSRRHVASGTARAMIVISKNANVATGGRGLRDAEEVVTGVAAALGCAPSEVLVASIGVIGRHYPIERVRAGLAAIPSPLPSTDADAVARADAPGGVGEQLPLAAEEALDPRRDMPSGIMLGMFTLVLSAFSVLTLVAFFAILLTGRYPRRPIRLEQQG